MGPVWAVGLQEKGALHFLAGGQIGIPNQGLVCFVR